MKAWEAKAKRDIPLGDDKVKKGDIITITEGVNEKYALWHRKYIWTLSERYVDETTLKPLFKE